LFTERGEKLTRWRTSRGVALDRLPGGRCSGPTPSRGSAPIGGRGARLSSRATEWWAREPSCAEPQARAHSSAGRGRL